MTHSTPNTCVYEFKENAVVSRYLFSNRWKIISYHNILSISTIVDLMPLINGISVHAIIRTRQKHFCSVVSVNILSMTVESNLYTLDALRQFCLWRFYELNSGLGKMFHSWKWTLTGFIWDCIASCIIISNIHQSQNINQQHIFLGISITIRWNSARVIYFILLFS